MKRDRQTAIAILALALMATAGLAQQGTTTNTQNINVDVKVGPKPGTRESMTVVRPGPDGETQVLQQETIKSGESAAPKAPSTAATDTTPRKARVVVAPAVFAQGLRNKARREFNEKFGLSDPTIIENPGFTSHLINALVNTRKLDVLEREDLKSAVKEIDFGESEYVDVEKAVKIGHMLNADYVVIPEIRILVVDPRKDPVPYVGQSQEKLTGKFGTTVRTVDVATSKIVASRIGEDNQIARVREKDNRSIVLADLITKLYANTAIREAANIVDTAYPIKIVSIIDDNNVIINRGNDAILKGETLNVYETGEMMIDPDTKDTLGYHEAYLGKLQVSEVNEKTSKAVFVEKKGDVKKGYICRRDKAATTTAPLQPPAPKLD